MKKFLIILFLFGFISVMGASNYKHSGYSVKCAKCVEESKKLPGHYINVAWRTNEPYRKEGDKVFAQYHCYGGHCYWAEIN